MKTIIAILLGLASVSFTLAQKKASGKVTTDENGSTLPLPGVNIHWKGTTQGTVTNEDGEFSLDASYSSTDLVFSFVGYRSDTVPAQWGTPMTILLKADLQLQEVVVAQKNKGTYASKITPFQTVTLNQAELCKAACCSLAESFMTNPSVDMSYSDAVTGAKQIQMLGLAGVYSFLQTENIPNLRGIATSHGLAFVPGPWLESIQVSKGSASVVNGYESITGQVNVEYRKPSDPEALFVNLYVADEKKTEGNLFVSSNVNEKWGTATLLHGRYYNSPADHNHDGFMDDPLVKQVNVLHRWDRKSGKGSIFRAGIHYIDEARTGGQMGFKDGMAHSAGGPYGVSIDNRRVSGFFKNGFTFDNANESSIAITGNVSSHRLRSMYGLGTYNADEKALYVNLIFASNLKGSDAHHVSTGFSFNGSWLDEQLYSQKSDYTNLVPGVYGEYTYKPNEKFTWMTGIRADHHNRFGTFATPRTHLRYSPSEQLVLRASAGKGYRHPSVWAENSHLLASARMLAVADNRIFEEAWNYGASIGYHIPVGNKELEVNMEYFRTDFLNQMVTDMETDAQQIWVRELDGKSYANSYQIDVRFELLPRLDITAAMRFNDVKQTIGGQLLDKAMNNRYKGLFTLNYSDRLKKWTFDVNTHFVGDGRVPQIPDTPEGYQVPGRFDAYQIVNAQVTRFFRHGSVYAGCENVTDYTQSHPVVDAGNPYGSYFDATRVWAPVMGRMFYIGMRYALNKK
ncbi:MAG: TonB-dependent receptor [Breznakibacter sp.]